jgi:hypothetical protein
MTRFIRRMPLAAVVVTCAMVVLGTASAGAQAIGYTASVNGVRGTYPGQRLDSVYVFNGVDIAGGPFNLAASIPWIRVKTTPSDLVDGVTVPAVASTSAGFGDPLMRFDVRVLDDRSRALQVGVAASVKLPVVDASSGRGTGRADYAVGTNVFKAVDRTSVMADVLFWKYGDPEGLDFSNAWSYSVAAARIFGDGRWSAIASLAGFSAGIGGMPAPVALNVGVMTLVAGNQSLGVTTSFGLNDGSSDFSVGMTWRISRQGAPTSSSRDARPDRDGHLPPARARD